MPNEEKTSSPSVRLLQLGTYIGDGSQKAISKQDGFGIPHYIAMHCASMVFWGVLLFWMLLSYNESEDSQAVFVSPLVFSAVFTGGLIVIHTIFDLVSRGRYLKARLFFKASIQEAWYWQGNPALRQQCVQPKNADEFKTIVYSANRLDRERALVYIAKEVWNHYDQLMIERDLKTDRLSKDWFMRQIAEDADLDVYEATEE
jgi:hypothetical protein